MNRNFFDLSHGHGLTADMGYLLPVCTMEVLPGDTFMGHARFMARVAPLVAPLMHDVEVRVHHWYVPNRLVWDAWDEWIVQKDEVSTMPTVSASDADEAALLDHMGIYPDTDLDVMALPVRAYNLIYNEFYRDQDIQTERTEDQLGLARICWEKDYLTVARPQPQQGDAVELGFSAGAAPIVRETNAPHVKVYKTGTETVGANNLNTGIGPGGELRENASPWAYLSIDPNGSLYADLTSMTGGIDINDLRQALALQRFAEARMRFGSRYADYLRFLGVNPSDGRLDRPEFIGGGKQSIAYSEVLATAEGTSTNVGDMKGHGIVGGRSKRYRKMFEEHGWFISLLSVRPRTMYTDMVPRQFLRSDPMDYWQREMEVLPWQAVSELEVHHDGDPDTVFGYVQKYEEYRHQLSYVSGSFRTTEKDWHMGRTFATPPSLNSSFLTCTPRDDIYADNSMPEMLMNVWNDVKARRLVRKSANIFSL